MSSAFCLLCLLLNSLCLEQSWTSQWQTRICWRNETTILSIGVKIKWTLSSLWNGSTFLLPLLLIQRFLNVKAHVMCGIYLGAFHLLLKGWCETKAWTVRTLNTVGHTDQFWANWSNQTQLCLNYRRRDSFFLLKLNLKPRNSRGQRVKTKRKTKPGDRESES